MNTVGDLLGRKPRALWSVAPDSAVYDALVLMAGHNIGAVVVLEDDKLTGILSERDYARKVILAGKTSRDTRVREIMTSDVAFVGPAETIDDCMNQMAERHIRHLPVLDRGNVVGVISIGDVVEAIIADRERTIGELERFIEGQGEIT